MFRGSRLFTGGVGSGFRRLGTQSVRYSVPLLGALYMLRNKAFMLELPETSAIIKGGYENKIRRASPIEKIFEVFATKKTKDGLRMTFFDLMRAVCPFNYSTKSVEEMKKYLEENPPKKTIELLDLDGDHHLNVYEFYIFWVFHEISIPDLVNSFCPEKSFDYAQMSTGQSKKKINLDVPITKQTMREFFKKRGDEAKLASRTIFKQDGRQAKVLASEIDENFVKFVNGLYKEKEVLTLQEFIDIKRQVRAEFNTLAVKENGSIPLEDFGKVLVSYAPTNMSNTYLTNLQNLDISKKEVTAQQYNAFKDFIADDIDQLYQAIKDIGIISERKFKRIYQQLETNNESSISDDQYQLLFRIMDTNGDARVTFEEFSNLLQNAHRMGRSIEKHAHRHSVAPITELKSLFWSWVSKAQRIWEIIKE